MFLHLNLGVAPLGAFCWFFLSLIPVWIKLPMLTKTKLIHMGISLTTIKQ